MAMVEFEEGGIQVDVAIVAKGLGIEPPLLLKAMREGRITSLCERGPAPEWLMSAMGRRRTLPDDHANARPRGIG